MNILTSIKIFLFFSVITGIIYPFAIYFISQTVFHDEANGSLIFDKNKNCTGSKLIGQRYESAKYFKSRPSRAGSGCDPLYSGGSNLGPTSSKLIIGQTDFNGVKQLALSYRQENNLNINQSIPIDAVTASGSGLDPDISLENALLQAKRIAKARTINETVVLKLIKNNLLEPQLVLLGEQRVNVNILNLALDQLK